MSKISFDFDSTLDRKSVQDFAKSLIEKNYDVWVVTTRCSIEYAKENLDHWGVDRVEKSNSKLFAITDNLDIKRENIVFTNGQFKIEYLKDKNFIFHLDDDSDELIAIFESGDNCKPINVDHFEWESDCLKALKLK